MHNGYTLFGQRLIDRKVISQQQLDEAIHKQQTSMGHRKVGEILVRLGYISKSHITENLADQLGIPIVKLSDRDIPERIRNMMDGSIAMLYRVVPIEERGSTLIIATADPTNINNLDNLSRLLDRPVEPVLTSPEEIREALAKYYNLRENTVESMLSTVSSMSTMSTLSTMSNLSSLGSSMSSLGSMSASDISMSSIDGIDFDEGELAKLQGGGTDADDDDSPVVRYVHQMILEAFR
ncbi:MAG: hypothetical protein HYZ00_00345, partial [Candidatus Hydrogenedentes bacterium]|nr:hypothetical protein [Candidatus Hydrogenedentota bacterium]